MPRNVPQQKQSQGDALMWLVEAEECRRSLKTFLKSVWPIFEPRDFADGWVIDCLCDHLEAVTRGDIRYLLVNIPPRHSKSSVISVVWPLWGWLLNPSEQYLCSSFNLNLAIRDNTRKRRIIEDTWFYNRFGKDIILSEEQNLKQYFTNTKNGHQQITSVGGSTTGLGGSVLICLWYNVEVTTDRGRIPIGEIVEKRLPVKVLAFDHKTNTARWQKIEEYESSPGRPSVRVTLNDGRFIDATADHPFYVVGKGYVPANQLTRSDRVLLDDSYVRLLRQGSQQKTSRYQKRETRLLQQGMSRRLPARRSRDAYRRTLRNLRQRTYTHSLRPQKVKTHLLQQRVPLCAKEQNCNPNRTEQNNNIRLRELRERVRAVSQLRRETRTPILQQEMLRVGRTWREESCLSGWESRTHLQELWQAIPGQAGDGCKIPLLFTRLSQSASQGRELPTLSSLIRQLCFLWGAVTHNSLQGGQEELLQSYMRQSSTQRVRQWGQQSEICGWRFKRAVSEAISPIGTTSEGTRRPQVSVMWHDEGREHKGTGRTSYRLRQRSQRDVQSGHSMQVLPRQNARKWRTKIPVETLLVRCVEPIATPERVYNLRVAQDHNFFANGVLTHNCDDPHNVDEAYSDAERQSAVVWFRESWTNRMNNAAKDKMVVVGQRIHEDDVSGYILKERPDWDALILPAFYEPLRKCFTSIGWEDPRKEEGELLWPERFSEASLNGLQRDLGPTGFSSQYQQSPVPAGGGQFKESWMRYFSISQDDVYTLHTPEGQKYIPKVDTWRFMTVDLAISQKTDADYTVVQCWAVTKERDILLLDQLRERMDNPQQQVAIRAMYYQYMPNFVQIEKVAYQLAIIQQLLREGVPCREYNPVKDKISRASTAAVLMYQGKIFFRSLAPWLDILKSELLHFPKASHDDCVDALSQAADTISSYADPHWHLANLQARAAIAQKRTVTPAQGIGITTLPNGAHVA